VPKRRADWLLGRVVAKAVVAEALADALAGDWPLRAIEIPSDRSGMPYARLAPEAGPVGGFAPGERLPISVSISHAEGHALCAATCSGPADGMARRTLGVDLGLVEPRSRAFVVTFFTEDEQRFVRDASPSERGLRANLIWCAKEAVLKVLGLGLTVDTRDLSCLPEPGQADPAEWPIAPADDRWRPFVGTCGPALLPRGGTIRGIWRSFPGFVGALASGHLDETSSVTENTAPCGSARTALLIPGISSGGTTTLPPSRTASSAAASVLSTQKSTLQCACTSALDPPPPIGTITATTSRGTGCWGSPPT
jgi:phosphopantetheinyl transferase (holo-ACP synthase)